MLSAARLGSAAELTLAWDPPVDGVTTGYIIYFGPEAQSPMWQVNVGNVTSYTVGGLASGGTYYFVVRAYDSGGTLSPPSMQVSGVAPPEPDLQRPLLSISAPAQGSVISGTVVVSVNASDNVGVAGVRFEIDGVDAGPEDTAAPYLGSWDTTLLGNGPHIVTAIARDAAGNSSQAVVTVTVANQISMPGVSMFASAVPAELKLNDGHTHELGLRFVSGVPGTITALRYWKGPSETGPHVGRVWSAAGHVLATVTFSHETASGWQEQALPMPVAIAPNVEYVVSVSTGPDGHFVGTRRFFNTAVATGMLYAPAGAGRFGNLGKFPNKLNSTRPNYFRDFVFVPAVTPSPADPPHSTRGRRAVPSPKGLSNIVVR